ncbi:hypothetical protein, variant 2 [Cladophialophora immunda]|nr:hypothetical protein, variant 1 [Cladophialophora immunda]XP_016249775.1 hypothetical protein, variant 2 [Cladophialophora immunda]KIW29558.1 hypothetical protein, variant 1 [Cladophialophora immunda]KIW29559.1 hypothetical protein, variant 2 [Cladophialophora immunda]
MKMLSRANVPTVEAGTFPAHKPQVAPRPAALNPVTPSDSVSQIGLSIPGSRENTTNNDMSALCVSRPMAPPQRFVAPAQPAQYSLSARPPPDGDLRPVQTPDLGRAYPKSNLALSTATTLVPETQHLRRPLALQNQSEDERGGDIRSRQSAIASQYPEFQALLGNTDLGLHGAQLASQITRSQVNHHTCSPFTGGSDGPVGRIGRIDEQLTSVQEDSSLTTTTTAKGKGKRNAANKPAKAPAVKKPRTAASRKKTTTKKAQEDKRVPTLDELLQQPGYSLLPNTTTTESRSIPCLENNPTELDQRKSVEIAETEYDADLHPAQGSSSLGGTTTGCLTRPVSRALSSIPMQYIEGSDESVPKAALAPCTPADQIIINPATPASPAAQAHTTALPQPTSIPHHREPGATPHTQEPQSSTLPVPDSALLDLAQQCLSADPAFDLSSAQSRLEAWIKLPEPTQATALRTYFCDLIMTEGFSQLCKSVELFWEGAILEGRMMTMTAAAGPGAVTPDPGSTHETDEEEI